MALTNWKPVNLLSPFRIRIVFDHHRRLEWPLQVVRSALPPLLLLRPMSSCRRRAENSFVSARNIVSPAATSPVRPAVAGEEHVGGGRGEREGLIVLPVAETVLLYWKRWTSLRRATTKPPCTPRFIRLRQPYYKRINTWNAPMRGRTDRNITCQPTEFTYLQVYIQVCFSILLVLDSRCATVGHPSCC